MYSEMDLTTGPMRDMAAPNICTFTRQQIQLLVSGSAHRQLTQWGDEEVLQDVLGRGPSHEPTIVVLAWDINELLGHLVCVIDPESPHAWILRIVLAPDFLWLGLHFHGKLFGRRDRREVEDATWR